MNATNYCLEITNQPKGNNKIRLTVKQAAEQLKVEYAVAGAIIKYMVDNGNARAVDKVKNSTGKGKAATVYEVSEKIEINFREAA